MSRPYLISARRLLRHFFRERHGHLGVMTGLMMLPLMAFVGVAVDLSHAYSLRTALREAADTAVLDIVSNSSLQELYQGNGINPGQLVNLARRAERVFSEQIPDNVKNQSNHPYAQANVTLSGTTISASLSFTGDMPTSFVHIIGFNTLRITGEAASSSNMSLFTDVHFLFDNSPSMAIAANDAERLRMVQMTKNYEKAMKRGFNLNGCAFACHDLSANQQTAENYFPLARAAGIKLRIDTMKDAVTQLLDVAAASAGDPDQFRYSVYDLGDSLTTVNRNGLEIRTRYEKDIAKVKRTVAAIEPMSTPYASFNSKAGSPLDFALAFLDYMINTIGNGSTKNNRQQLVIFMTDGVANAMNIQGCTTPTWSNGQQCTAPILYENCNEMKKRGIRIAVLYTVYQPMPSSPYYVQRVAPFAPQIRPALEACASPGLFRNVDYGESLDDALKALFKRSIQYVRLTK